MSRPDWTDRAEQNTVGKQLGEVSNNVDLPVNAPVNAPVEAAAPKKKVGRKKALIKRRQVMSALSEYQLDKMDIAEGLLKGNRIKVTRGRSETTELAIALMTVMLKTESQKEWALGVLKDFHEYEEKNLNEFK